MYSNQIQSIIDYKDLQRFFKWRNCDESMDEDAFSFYENVILC